MRRLDDALVQRLERALGAKAVVTDPEILPPYGQDESGDGPYPAEGVLRPKTPDEVRTALRLCHEAGVPVTPRGGGTGKSGGALPVAGGVVLSLSGMNRILDIDTADLLAVVEPGVILERFADEVEAQGLFYPPDQIGRAHV